MYIVWPVYQIYKLSYFSFHSDHPFEHKQVVITRLNNKILTLSHPKFQFKNLKTMTNIL